MRGKGRFGQWFSRLMTGRYGVDHLSRFLSIAVCVLLVLSLVLRSLMDGRVSAVINWIAIAGLFWSYWRSLSRNFTARQRENIRYLTVQNRFTSFFRRNRDNIRYRKEYKFYQCPGCKTTVRVPAGKGRIRITCRRCGYSFEKKT